MAKGVYPRKPRQSSCMNRTKILDFLLEFRSENGYSPSIREICAGIGCASTNTVQYHVSRMVQEGLLASGSRPRALIPIPKG